MKRERYIYLIDASVTFKIHERLIRTKIRISVNVSLTIVYKTYLLVVLSRWIRTVSDNRRGSVSRIRTRTRIVRVTWSRSSQQVYILVDSLVEVTKIEILD